MSNFHRTMHSRPQSEAELAASMALVPCQHCGRPGGEHAIGCFALLDKQNHCQRSTDDAYAAVPITEFFDEPFVAEDASYDEEPQRYTLDEYEAAAADVTPARLNTGPLSEAFREGEDIEAEVGPSLGDKPLLERSEEWVMHQRAIRATGQPLKPQRLDDGGFTVTASEQVDKITKLKEVAQRANAKYTDKAIRLEPVSNQTQQIYKLCIRPKQLQPTTEDLGANNWNTVVGGSLDEILDWLNSH